MSLSIVVTPGYTFPDGTAVDNTALRRAALPTINLQGAVDASVIADGSISNAKMANNSTDLSQKALDKSLVGGKVADGGLTAANLIADAYFYAAATLSAGVYGFALTPTACNPAAYAAGQIFHFKANVTNTGATNINVNSLGEKDLFRPDGTELSAGDIKAGQVVSVIFDGTQFQLITALYQNTEKWVKFVGITKTSGVVFTVNTGTDVATATAHGMSTAQALTVITGTTLPAPLAYTTVYYARVIDADTFTFHPTAADASANTNKIDLTTTGTGTHTLYYLAITRSSGVANVIRTPGASATNAPAAGDYTINFTSAFSYAGFVAQVLLKANSGKYPLFFIPPAETAATTSKRIKCAELDFTAGTIAAIVTTTGDFTEVHFAAKGAGV